PSLFPKKVASKRIFVELGTDFSLILTLNLFTHVDVPSLDNQIQKAYCYYSILGGVAIGLWL
ncbi:MAG: hypothetical protein ACKOKH_05915, partial [Bacteroidota bacterium]